MSTSQVSSPITALIASVVANSKAKLSPKCAEDWFLLRDAWGLFSDDDRRHFCASALGSYMCEAKIQTFDDVCYKILAAQHSTLIACDKRIVRALSQAIVDSHYYSNRDKTVRGSLKARKQRIYDSTRD
ncbi:hypothetical protein P9Z72_07620 [Glaesserella parasuis]|uniref:hypothetical protein n=1 Tax=Glaesserella parasuis TaxID=738 RepID=UPI0024368A1B|nr:hypothetical protein [Glaesserella parasuis]MDG6312389.1 hypothetical protein [Glaesserella parasuis]